MSQIQKLSYWPFISAKIIQLFCHFLLNYIILLTVEEQLSPIGF